MFQCSSASRKFLKQRRPQRAADTRRFQCSSASRKFLKSLNPTPRFGRGWSFSALQRAENSSNVRAALRTLDRTEFQCSSASRKFLKTSASARIIRRALRFQCSSASRKFLNRVAVLLARAGARVSVLFSEPKIPQLFLDILDDFGALRGFSALQRAENSSIRAARPARQSGAGVSVLFSEPKIPQWRWSSERLCCRNWSFSALQRAENSSMVKLRAAAKRR